jgi:hypothetical protein
MHNNIGGTGWTRMRGRETGNDESEGDLRDLGGPGAQCEEEKSRSITSREIVFLSSIHGAKDRCGEQTPRASLHTEEASNRTEPQELSMPLKGQAHRGIIPCRRGKMSSLSERKGGRSGSWKNTPMSAQQYGIRLGGESGTIPFHKCGEKRLRRGHTHTAGSAVPIAHQEEIHTHTKPHHRWQHIREDHGNGNGKQLVAFPTHTDKDKDINGKKPKAKKRDTRTKKGDTCWQPGILILKSLAQGGLIVPLRWEVRPFHRSLLTPSRELESFPLTWLLIPPPVIGAGEEAWSQSRGSSLVIRSATSHHRSWGLIWGTLASFLGSGPQSSWSTPTLSLPL